MRAACIGVGNVGRSWAIVFARAGWDATLWDIDPAAVAHALTLIRTALADLEAAGLMTEAEAALARIRPAATLAAAVADADFVQESASEEAGVKQALFQ